MNRQMTLCLPVWMVVPLMQGDTLKTPEKSDLAVRKMAQVKEHLHANGFGVFPVKFITVGFKRLSIDYMAICGCEIGGNFAEITFDEL